MKGEAKTMDNPLENLNPLIPALYASGMTIYFINRHKIRMINSKGDLSIGAFAFTFVTFWFHVLMCLILVMLPHYIRSLELFK